MAVCLERNENALDPNIAARAAALRAGTKPPELAERFHGAAELGLHNADGNYELPPIAPLPAKTEEVRSRRWAKPMKRSDIANVQFLNVETAREILAEVAATAPEIAAKALKHVEESYRALLTESERFTLSAMAARKYLRDGVPV